MIRFEHVSKSFGPKKVLDDVSYEIAKGEVFMIVGPSGTGKSVSLKHMVRLLTPDEGRVLVAGEDISHADGAELERMREHYGYLFQGGALLAWMNVADNVALPLREKTQMGEEEIHDKVMRTLALVGLENDAEKMPSEISGGMQKRAGLARAIIRDPVVVTHDLNSALSIGHRIAMLKAGRIVELSTPDEFRNSKTPEVVEFMEAQFKINREAD